MSNRVFWQMVCVVCALLWWLGARNYAASASFVAAAFVIAAMRRDDA